MKDKNVFHENDGNWIPIGILALVVIFPIVAMFIPGNAAFLAPLGSKILFISVELGAAWVAKNAWQDNWTWINNPRWNQPLQWLTVVALAILAYCVLMVWHSGPLGLSTNNI